MTLQVGCDFAKNPMKFNRFRILSLFYLFYIHEGYRYYLDMFTEEIKGIKVYDTHHLLKFSIKMFYFLIILGLKNSFNTILCPMLKPSMNFDYFWCSKHGQIRF